MSNSSYSIPAADVEYNQLLAMLQNMLQYKAVIVNVLFADP
jgi:hypothetical protein